MCRSCVIVIAGGRPGGVDDMVGRQVRITKGPHKGLIGTIKSANPTQYRVELNARGKTLPFPRDHVREDGANRHSIDTGAAAAGAGGVGMGAGGIYGAAGAATPAWIGGGGMTPAVGLAGGMGAATPAYGLGGQTPFLGASADTDGFMCRVAAVSQRRLVSSNPHLLPCCWRLKCTRPLAAPTFRLPPLKLTLSSCARLAPFSLSPLSVQAQAVPRAAA